MPDWADDMDRAMERDPEMFGMVLDDHGNPVAARTRRLEDRVRMANRIIASHEDVPAVTETADLADIAASLIEDITDLRLRAKVGMALGAAYLAGGRAVPAVTETADRHEMRCAQCGVRYDRSDDSRHECAPAVTETRDDPYRQAILAAAAGSHHERWDSDWQDGHTTVEWTDCKAWPCSVLAEEASDG